MHTEKESIIECNIRGDLREEGEKGKHGNHGH
jgi:hypothetical protein